VDLEREPRRAVVMSARRQPRREAGEFPLATVMVTLGVLLALTVQFLVTIARRTEPPLYVSLWYLIAAFVWGRT